VRSDDALKIMQRGHADFETTRIYLREAENLSAGFGAVFPPVPADLLRKPTRARGVSAFGFGGHSGGRRRWRRRSTLRCRRAPPAGKPAWRSWLASYRPVASPVANVVVLDPKRRQPGA
jgi:hypothetical protein